MNAEELFLHKYGNKITASESWVIRFAEEYAKLKVDAVLPQADVMLSLLRETIYLLSIKQPDNCPNWIEGEGDCNKPECEFCRIKICIDELECNVR
jgi:hypothetical protein